MREESRRPHQHQHDGRRQRPQQVEEAHCDHGVPEQAEGEQEQVVHAGGLDLEHVAVEVSAPADHVGRGSEGAVVTAEGVGAAWGRAATAPASTSSTTIRGGHRRVGAGTAAMLREFAPPKELPSPRRLLPPVRPEQWHEGHRSEALPPASAPPASSAAPASARSARRGAAPACLPRPVARPTGRRPSAPPPSRRWRHRERRPHSPGCHRRPPR